MPVRYTAQSGNWTSPSTWQGGTVPQAGDQVVIQSGHTVIYDVVEGSANDVELGTGGTSLDVDIYGTLRFDPNATQPLRLRFKGYIQIRSGGRLEIGTVNSPFPTRATLWKTTAGSTMISLLSGGTLSLVGSPNLPTDQFYDYKFFTFITAIPASNQITVQDNLNWSVGDWIVIPRIAPVATSPSNWIAQVTEVSGNTLTLSSTLPSDLQNAVGNLVVKLTRNIIINNADTDSSRYTIDRAGTIEALRWVYFHRTAGIGNIRYFEVADGIAYFVSTYCTTTTATALTRLAGTNPTTLVGCCTALYNSENTLAFRKGFLAGARLTSGRTVIVEDSFVGNGIFDGAFGGSFSFRNCKLYSFTRPYAGVLATFVNCEFYGIGVVSSFSGYSVSLNRYINCKFYPFPNTVQAASRFDWNVLSAIVETYVNCELYGTWVEPSIFANQAEHPQADVPQIRFINKITQSGTIAEQIFRAGGIITSDATDKPNDQIPYSYRFEPKNANFPLVHDFPVYAFDIVRVWVKAVSGSPQVKIQLLKNEDMLILPTLVTPLSELNISPLPTEWTPYELVIPQVCTLRICVQGASGQVLVAFTKYPTMFVDSIEVTFEDVIDWEVRQ